MSRWIKYVLIAIITAIIVDISLGDDPPRDTIKAEAEIEVPSRSLQIEQKVLNDQIKERLTKWDSLIMKQDSLIKKE